ncbi:MAG: PAS domain S-box protein [Hydrogenophaga sp.]|jgi:PAS domain S-box-containing protein|nr:PAS domain S-box protein [Hydrogenophaga sp.]
MNPENAQQRDPDEVFNALFGVGLSRVAVLDRDGKVIWLSAASRQFFQISPGGTLDELVWTSLWSEPNRPGIEEAMRLAWRGVRARCQASRVELRASDAGSEMELVKLLLLNGSVEGLVVVLRELGGAEPVESISQLKMERDLAAGLIAGQKHVLELAASDAPIAAVLSRLVETAEAHAQGRVNASILLLDGEHLRVGAAPSLPASYNEAIDGMAIGPTAGSCGTAAFLKQPVFVRDIESDPLWADFRDLAAAHGLRSCWSLPILSTHGKVLGTLAYYFHSSRDPTAAEAQSMPILVHTAALVLERHREAHKRQAVETALRRSEAKLERFINSNIIGIVTYVFEGSDGADATILNANDAFLDMLGYSQAELEAGVLTWVGLTPPEWIEVDRQARRQLRDVGTIDTYQKEFFRKDGSRATVYVGAANLESSRDEGIAYVLDISETKKSAQALRDSEAKFRTITNAMPQMVWSTLPNGHHDYYNDQWYEFTGVARGSTDGEGWNAIFHPEDQERARQAWLHSLESGESYEIEYRLRHHSGQFRWTLGRALPVRDDTGAIVRWMGTCTDIHEQRQAQDHLQESHRRKDEFLAMLAHELRNPLAPISAAAELLRIETSDKQLISSVSQVIARQAAHMTGLIEDLLDVSRVTRGQISLASTTLQVRGLVEEAVEQVRSSVEQHRHRLEVILPVGEVWIQGDEKRLVQVLANLLNNAVKYTPDGGRVVLRTVLSGDQVVISVRDDGIGMTQGLIEQVFEMFVQGERSSDRSQGGLGIGLALVKSLVTLHGGRVTAHSAGLGKGSEFTVSLPISSADPVANRRAEAPAQSDAAKGLRVLLVDDNVDAAQMLALLLESVGHTVRVEHHPVRALQESTAFQPEVCLLDIGLPEMNGNELAQQLKGIPALKDTLLIAVTGYGQPHDLAQAFAHGFSHHFVKPVNMGQLMATLDGHFRLLHPEDFAGGARAGS